MRRIPLAWCNIIHNKACAATALCGVAFSILLLYMQLGFFDSCFRSSTMIYDQLRFDVVLLSSHYVHMRSAGAIPKSRLFQAKSVPEVAQVAPLYVANSTYRVPETRIRREITVLGIDLAYPPFRIPEVTANSHKLAKVDTAIMDRTVGKGYGRVQAGLMTELGNRQVEIVGTYANGTGFLCDASVVLSDRTLERIFNGYSLDRVTMGLVMLAPGAHPQTAAQRLREILPADVQVLTRREIESRERRYFVLLKPIGIMFSAGVLLAVSVGAVTLYQILSSEMKNRIRECATLIALGHSGRYMQLVVVQQAVILALIGFIPATLIAIVLYEVTRMMTSLPLVMTWLRVALVLTLSVLMCSVSGLLVSIKVRRADPAELF